MDKFEQEEEKAAKRNKKYQNQKEQLSRLNQSLGIIMINAVKDKDRMVEFEKKLDILQRDVKILMDERLKKESSSSSDDDPFERNPKNYGRSLGLGLFD